MCKLCRREGKKLFLKGDRCNTSKCAIVKRNYLPGQHGHKQGPTRKMSVYGRQLREKQTARRLYNIKENQFSLYFKKATRKKGNSEEHFFTMLESRFDNVIFRLGLATSRNQARQMIGHGHFLINGKKVNIPSYQLKVNDAIDVKKKSLETPLFKNAAERLKTQESPEWLYFDLKTMSAKVLAAPDFKKSVTDFDMKQIVEYYSR